MQRRLRKAIQSVLLFSLFLVVAAAGHAKIYKWVDEDGKVHFSDRRDPRVDQQEVRVKPGPSDWSRFDINVETVDVELTEAEHQQIVDGVNNVYEFFDRVLSFDMYQTVPVNILIFRNSAEYRAYLIRKNRGWATASYGLFMASENQIALYIRQDRSLTFNTIKHEVSHAVVSTIIPYAPAWLNEGLAEQMEMLQRDEEGLYFERHAENRWYVDKAREQGRLADIDEFLKLSSGTWRHSELSGNWSLRAQSGQFVYFLFSKANGRDFVVRLMHNFNRGDRTLAYYLVDENYIGGVTMLSLDWRRWLHDQGDAIVRL